MPQLLLLLKQLGTADSLKVWGHDLPHKTENSVPFAPGWNVSMKGSIALKPLQAHSSPPQGLSRAPSGVTTCQEVSLSSHTSSLLRSSIQLSLLTANLINKSQETTFSQLQLNLKGYALVRATCMETFSIQYWLCISLQFSRKKNKYKQQCF